jgi:hypothetical protein
MVENADNNVNPNSNVSLTWFNDPRIAIITFNDSSRSTIDAWVKLTIETIRAWPQDQPMRLMHEALSKQVTFSPYLRSRAMEMIREIRPLIPIQNKVAVVVSRSVAAQIAQLFTRSIGTRNTQIFFSREDALAWLRKYQG